MPPFLSRCLRPLAALTLLAGAARATWSVVVVDTATGEVCVASATCLANFDLERWLPVLRVGEGVAAAQSQVDTSGNNRAFIWARIQSGWTPQMILDGLAQLDPNHQGRQYGIVTLAHDPATFTGSNAGFARHGVAGQFGTIKYAVQGNLLTANSVVDKAVDALRYTDGDLGQRVMAAMMAAARMGGDGRCSCSPSQPTSCGAPPPSFTKSCHVAFIVLGRVGDTNGNCNVTVGCASGNYYLDLQRITGTGGQDPILDLRVMYNAWRASWSGRPDHIRSRVEPGAHALVADGASSAAVRVRLIDVDGIPLASGGASLAVAWTGQGAPLATPGPVTDHGDGSYTFDLVAGITPGVGTWSITADDGQGPVRLYPDLAVRVDPLAQLHAGRDFVSLSAGADVPFTINLTPASAGRPYILLGSTTGTQPGQLFRGLQLALNPGAFFTLTVDQPGTAQLPGSIGTLDATGRGLARFLATPAELASFGGSRFDWIALRGGGPSIATNAVGFDVVP